MNKITFHWDEQKNKINQQKHGITFAEAESVFFDDYAIQFWDEDHSQEEERFLLLGINSKKRLTKIIARNGKYLSLISPKIARTRIKQLYIINDDSSSKLDTAPAE